MYLVLPSFFFGRFFSAGVTHLRGRKELERHDAAGRVGGGAAAAGQRLARVPGVVRAHPVGVGLGRRRVDQRVGLDLGQ